MSFGKFPKLKELYLYTNKLDGSIPTTLGKLLTLEVLSLSQNELSGQIPTSFGNFCNLKGLYLSDNKLNGVVPESLGQLLNLTTLFLYNNSLDGVLTEVHFAKLYKLEHLSLTGNSLSLNVRHGWIPPFQLIYIDLGDSEVGPQFPQWLQTQTRISTLIMNNASISDSIPTWFENIFSSMSDIEVDLSNNKIYGKVPNLLTLSDIVIDLSDNLLEGPLPESSLHLTALFLGNNKITGPLPLNIDDLFPRIINLDLSNNRINGSIPNSLCKMRSLLFLSFSKNHLSGDIPHCWGGLQNLMMMDLSVNNLSGRIPSSFGQLSFLRALHLSNNNFHGELASALRHCTNLEILDLGNNLLSGRIPTWIAENLASLRILKLRSNKYTGTIPQKLCYSSSLQILDVAGNNLTGTVPHCLGNFSSMVFNNFSAFLSKDPDSIEYLYASNLFANPMTQVIKGRELEYHQILSFVVNLDLSDNNFVGHIPQELTALHALTSLNLSKNRFTGNIPEKIGQLTSLQSLDFSENQLSGPIPQSLSSLFRLGVLNLSYNNLSGQIPTGNQLQTLEDPSIYAGNHYLCGPPVKRKCTGAEAPQSQTYIYLDTKGGGDDLISKWFYIGLSSGFVVGFCGVFGFFLLN